MIGDFWVGQVPAQPMQISVTDERGFPVDLSRYTTVALKMLDGDNRTIDTSNGVLTVQSALQGRLSYAWPSTSLFSRPGVYIMQLELAGTGVKDITRTVPVRVRRFGGRDVRFSE